MSYSICMVYFKLFHVIKCSQFLYIYIIVLFLNFVKYFTKFNNETILQWGWYHTLDLRQDVTVTITLPIQQTNLLFGTLCLRNTGWSSTAYFVKFTSTTIEVRKESLDHSTVTNFYWTIFGT